MWSASIELNSPRLKHNKLASEKNAHELPGAPGANGRTPSFVRLRYKILQEVVELFRVRVQPPGLEVANFVIGDLSLKANDISVLNSTLGDGVLRLHEFDHVGFDFLGGDAKSEHHVGESPLFVTS